MKTYLTIWPNSTFTLTRAANINELFSALDEEDDPRNEGVATYLLPKNWRSVTQDRQPNDPRGQAMGLMLQDGLTPDIEDLPQVDFNGIA